MLWRTAAHLSTPFVDEAFKLSSMLSGARVQQPLWASTSTKNPAYRDVMYIEELVGADTVNTVPEATLNAFRDHGVVRPAAITEHVEGALAILDELPSLGVDLDAITAELLDKGLEAFDEDFAALIGTIEEKIKASGASEVRASLGALEGVVDGRIGAAGKERAVGRIWRHDHTLWKPDPTEITDRLGSFLRRERLARQRRFVHAEAGDLKESCVRRDSVSRSQDDDVPGNHFAGRDSNDPSLSEDVGLRRGETLQGLEGPFRSVLLNEAEDRVHDHNHDDEHGVVQVLILPLEDP